MELSLLVYPSPPHSHLPPPPLVVLPHVFKGPNSRCWWVGIQFYPRFHYFFSYASLLTLPHRAVPSSYPRSLHISLLVLSSTWPGFPVKPPNTVLYQLSSILPCVDRLKCNLWDCALLLTFPCHINPTPLLPIGLANEHSFGGIICPQPHRDLQVSIRGVRHLFSTGSPYCIILTPPYSLL